MVVPIWGSSIEGGADSEINLGLKKGVGGGRFCSEVTLGLKKKEGGGVCDLVGVRLGGGGSVLFRGHSWV